MPDSFHVVCPQCDVVNRIPRDRPAAQAVCGQCKAKLFEGRAIELDGRRFERHAERNDIPVIADFWAPWCGPCHAVAPQLALLAKKKAGSLLVAKVNTEELGELAGRFAIRSIPTMILFADGREQRRISGAMPADAIAHGIGV